MTFIVNATERARRLRAMAFDVDGVLTDGRLYYTDSGTEIKVDDEDYLILREDEILAKLSGAAKAASGKK